MLNGNVIVDKAIMQSALDGIGFGHDISITIGYKAFCVTSKTWATFSPTLGKTLVAWHYLRFDDFASNPLSLMEAINEARRLVAIKAEQFTEEVKSLPYPVVWPTDDKITWFVAMARWLRPLIYRVRKLAKS